MTDMTFWKMKNKIPTPIISVVAEVVAERETHTSMNGLFLYAEAPGDPPLGNKQAKAIEWLRRINNEAVDPLQTLGRIIELYMEEEPSENKSIFGGFESSPHDSPKRKIEEVLARFELQYRQGGYIATSLAMPTKTLEEFIRNRDIPPIEHEFDRAMKNAESNPREAVSAASNILESLCKEYISAEHLQQPARQDLKSVWGVVRKHLGFDPSVLEDKDLQTILTGLFAVVEGIGALRTHASSAHGAGRKAYNLEPRHARLAIHAAHTITLYVLESWDKRKSPTNAL